MDGFNSSIYVLLKDRSFVVVLRNSRVRSRLRTIMRITYYKKLPNCPRELTSLAVWRRRTVSAPSVHDLLNAKTARFPNFQTT
jgi:hypothetical protein